MNKFQVFLQWARDPFGYKRLHRRHVEVQKEMVATTTVTEKVTENMQRRLLREQRRRHRASRANVIERVVLGQPHRRSTP